MPAAPVSFEPKVDAYINRSRPFAQPILTHLRKLVHKAAPRVTEEIKWSMPFFLVNGIILCNMAAFKEHCSFGFWGDEMKEILKAAGRSSKDGMGSLGRIATLADLPGDKELAACLKAAAALILDGTRTSSFVRPRRAPRPEAPVPPELTAALKSSKPAAATFAAFPPGCRREYIDWIAEAKRAQTRTSRSTQAVTWMAEGKKRNWKYENC